MTPDLMEILARLEAGSMSFDVAERMSLIRAVRRMFELEARADLQRRQIAEMRQRLATCENVVLNKNDRIRALIEEASREAAQRLRLRDDEDRADLPDPKDG